MVSTVRSFQVFAKPISYVCNLSCKYCYYLKTRQIYPNAALCRMSDDILKEYIIQHINASTDPVIQFSWHGGEPTILGLNYFRKIVAFQHKYCPPNQQIINGIQTNGTLLDDAWCSFFANEGFRVGLSLDGPQELHDQFRVTKHQMPTYESTMRGYRLLQKYQVNTDVLCVVSTYNVQFPLQIYRFFKQIGAQSITFLPLVEPSVVTDSGVTSISVPPDAWGQFLCVIFNEWRDQDIGKVTVRMFEEAIRSAINQEHALCIFRPICGDIPALEYNGDVYSCDHYVDPNYYLGNIMQSPLTELLNSPKQHAFGTAKLATLPRYCQDCEVRAMCNGGCPKNRILKTPDREQGLNYLCRGYKRFFKHCQPFVSTVAELWKQHSH